VSKFLTSLPVLRQQFYVIMNIYFCANFNITCDVVTGLLIFVDIYPFNYLFSHAHIEARCQAHAQCHTQAHMYHECTGSNSKTRHRSLVGRSGRRFVVREKGLVHTHTYIHAKMTKHRDLKSKKIRANKASSKASNMLFMK